MELFKNDYIKLFEENNKVYITTFKIGFEIKNFDRILKENPRIKLMNFNILKKALMSMDQMNVEIGKYLPEIELTIAKNKMQATIVINETIEKIRNEKHSFEKKIQLLMAENNIIHGIQQLNLEQIPPNKTILIAQGTPAQKGADAIITYLEHPERKPVIRDDGKADYFDMNFIFEIKKDMWLGEKILPTAGVPGKAIDGSIVVPQAGKDLPFKYDRQSAYEVEEGGKIILKSRINGVLEYREGMISVNKHLPINGDVGLETGNIDFSGTVTVKGTVQAGFTLIAKGDICIESPEGVTAAKLIKSIEGDVFIRGGVFGIGQTKIEAGRNIFIKHVNEAHLVAGEEIIIGSYALSSMIKANSVIFNEISGKVIGGTTVAKKNIVVAYTGNRLERRTELIINSMNKQDVMLVIQERAATLKKLQMDTLKIEETVIRYMDMINQLSENQRAAFEQAKQIIDQNNERIEQIDHEIKQFMTDLRNAGDEEIYVTKEANAGTYIQIGKKSAILNQMTKGRFKIELGELNV